MKALLLALLTVPSLILGQIPSAVTPGDVAVVPENKAEIVTLRADLSLRRAFLATPLPGDQPYFPIYDGDTLFLDFDLGLGIVLHRQRVRLQLIDAPEISTRDLAEKAAALASRAELLSILSGKEILVRGATRDLYGRWLCRLFVRRKNDKPIDVYTDVSLHMLKTAHAVPWPKK